MRLANDFNDRTLFFFFLILGIPRPSVNISISGTNPTTLIGDNMRVNLNSGPNNQVRNISGKVKNYTSNIYKLYFMTACDGIVTTNIQYLKFEGGRQPSPSHSGASAEIKTGIKVGRHS